MERTAFRTLTTLLFAFLFLQLQAGEPYSPKEIQARLETMECIVKPRYTSAVENYIKGYFAHDAYKAKLILSRTVTFFPIFEKYLDEHGMPEDLKYLSVLESALNPKAVSRVGATGLWQFMKETGTGYGLKINSRVDERSCPNRSTMAAMEYLANAFERFGSWELAIASYNCGAGNIRKAIKRAGGETDYWEISKYLPRETRNFVPAFLGAKYMVNYYHLHQVAPEYGHLDLQLTESQLIYNEMSFETIAAVTGIPVSVVETLNPAYKKGYIPANDYGHWLVLPRRTMQAMKDYVELLQPDHSPAIELPPLPEIVEEADYTPDEYYHKLFYTTLEGDRLKALGKTFNCSGYNLKAWNNLTENQLKKGQELMVWFPREIKRFPPSTNKITIVPPKSKALRNKADTRPAPVPISAIEQLKLAPVPVDNYPCQQLEALAATVAEQSAAAATEDKKPVLQRVRKWVHEKPFLPLKKNWSKKEKNH